MKILVALFIILFVTIIAIFSFLLGNKNAEEKAVKNFAKLCTKVVSCKTYDNKAISQATNPVLKFLDTSGPKEKFVKSTSIEQILKGELVSFTDNTWTIKQENNTYKINNNSNKTKPIYQILKAAKDSPKTEKGYPVTFELIKAEKKDLVIGDNVEVFIVLYPPDWVETVQIIRIYR